MTSQVWWRPAEEILDEPLDSAGPRRGWWPRSLQGRLVGGVVTLVALLVLVIGATTFFALRVYLDHQLDHKVQSLISNPYQLEGLFVGASSDPNVSTHDVWAAALSTSGELLAYPQSRGVNALSLDDADRQRVTQLGEDDTLALETTDGKHLRVVAMHVFGVEIGGVPYREAVAVVGLSTKDEYNTLTTLLRNELLIGASAILLAFLLTSWGVRRSLRNLHAVTGTAREVTAELSPTGTGLDRRVPVVEDGTEVGRLAESINTLLAAVELQFAARLDNEQRMRQFLADASHELRTPLTSIRGFAELARLRGAGDTADELARIEAEGTRMSRLVDDLLTLARTDRDDAAPERQLIDVAELIDDAVAGTRAAFPGRRIETSADAGLAVVGEYDQLLRVVRNLVTNAAVHTNPAGPIHVLAALDGVDVVIRVVDRGPGLPPEQAAHAFERFWRADKARTRARGGSGLGLSIVASLVRANGGSVRFDSSVEAGSTVTVRLPSG